MNQSHINPAHQQLSVVPAKQTAEFQHLQLRQSTGNFSLESLLAADGSAEDARMAMHLAEGSRLAEAEAAKRRPHIQELWLRPHSQDLVVVQENGVVQDVLQSGASVLNPIFWSRIRCMAPHSTVQQGQSQRNEWQEPWTCLKIRVGHAGFQQLLTLALPQRNRFVALLLLEDGSLCLAPYKQGLVLHTWLWAQQAGQPEGYRAQFLTYGHEQLLPVAVAPLEAAKPYTPGMPMTIDWAQDDVPLQLIQQAPLSTLG